MRFLKYILFMFLAGVLAAGGLYLARDTEPVLHMTGRISSELKKRYDEILSAEMNAQGITLILNGKEYALTGEKALMMSDQMEIMLPACVLNDIFRCSAALRGDGTVTVSWDTRHDYSNIYRGENSKASLALDEEERVSLQEAAQALGYDYAWDEEERQVSLTAPVLTRESLPASFDLREEGRVSPVRDQGERGSCWAFAAVAAMESALLPGQSWNFSEENMINRNPFATGGAGGDFNMALAYLLAWKGPVMEYEDEYGDDYSPDDLSAAVHVQDAVILNERDYDQVKSLVYHCGAVQSAMYSPSEMSRILDYYDEDHAAYYYPQSRECSHDMDIVGWDDHFPREYFKNSPSSDGAFICRNSWGEGFGENGYFYISYEDPNIAIYGAAYTGIEAPDNFDRIYQADELGWTGSIGFDGPDALFAAAYTAQEEEDLAGAGFYATEAGTWYDLYLVHDFAGPEDLNERELLTCGYLPDKGYFTIRTGRKEELRAGERFALVLEIYTSGSEHPVAMEFAGNELSGGADISDGESYVSGDGYSWSRMEDTQECNACLKAYTQLH